MFPLRQWRWQGPSVEPSVRTLHLSNGSAAPSQIHTFTGSRQAWLQVPHRWRANRKDQLMPNKLACCYHCWPYPTMWCAVVFILKLTQWALKQQHVQAWLIFSHHLKSNRKMSADPPFLNFPPDLLMSFRHFFCLGLYCVNNYETWRTLLTALQQMPGETQTF